MSQMLSTRMLITIVLASLMPLAHADFTTICAQELGTVSVAHLADVRRLPEWQTSFSRFAKDHRYYEITQETINPEFEHRYFVIRDATGAVVGIQPFLLLDQDLLEATTARVKKIAGAVRRLWPSFLKLRVLMVGNAAGPGHLSPDDEADRGFVARQLAQTLPQLARDQGARLAILKEFPRAERQTLRPFDENGFVVFPGLPHTSHDLSKFETFEDYRKSFNRNGRRRLDRHLEASVNPDVAPIALEVRESVPEPLLAEAFDLYRQTLERAPMRFEVLTPEYFREIGRRMPDRARFFFWRQNGKLVAMAFCLAEGETLLTEYLGLDYEIARETSLYFRVQYDVIRWAIDNKYRSIVSTPLVYEPKLYLGHDLKPVDLYVAQALTPKLNWLFGRFAKGMDPSRAEPLLKRFSNFRDLELVD